LDLSEGTALPPDAELITTVGVVIDDKSEAGGVSLQLQAGQHIFEAILFSRQGSLPRIATGSTVRVTGVCNFGAADALAAKVLQPISVSGPFAVLMRGPGDIAVVRGPPWWTWKRAAALIFALSIILCGTLLWIRLLRRRLLREQAAQLAFSRQILHGQESERRRIAANLHDSLGQDLLVIKNQVCLAMQSGSDQAALRTRLDEISGVASQAIEEVRQITLGLRPYHLDRLGLTQAIQAAVSLVGEHSAILFATHVDNVDGLFDSESEIHVYRIVQESVNNIIKHSGASEAAVVVKLNAASIVLSIRDNGRGFEAGVNGSASGYGLNGITERVRILGGALTIDSRPTQGAAITVHIPVSGTHPCPKN